METMKPIAEKFIAVNYVYKANLRAKFIAHLSTGDFLVNGWTAICIDNGANVDYLLTDASVTATSVN